MQVQVHHTLISAAALEASLGFRKNMVGSRVVLSEHAVSERLSRCRIYRTDFT